MKLISKRIREVLRGLALNLSAEPKLDGEAQVFNNEVDTGIPALQELCRFLPIEAREEAIHSMDCKLLVTLRAIRSYMESMADGSLQFSDRQVLAHWESRLSPELESHPTSGQSFRQGGARQQLEAVSNTSHTYSYLTFTSSASVTVGGEVC